MSPNVKEVFSFKTIFIQLQKKLSNFEIDSFIFIFSKKCNFSIAHFFRAKSIRWSQKN